MGAGILQADREPGGPGPQLLAIRLSLIDVQIDLGIPLALIPIIIAAAWQLSGFAMAMYLAGLAGIPAEELEAASMDGAGWFKSLRYIVLPQLWPITVTCLILLLHTSLKIFDLVVSMSLDPDQASSPTSPASTSTT